MNTNSKTNKILYPNNSTVIQYLHIDGINQITYQNMNKYVREKVNWRKKKYTRVKRSCVSICINILHYNLCWHYFKISVSSFHHRSKCSFFFTLKWKTMFCKKGFIQLEHCQCNNQLSVLGILVPASITSLSQVFLDRQPAQV